MPFLLRGVMETSSSLHQKCSWSEGYLCLRPSQFKSLTDVLQAALAGDYPVIHRWRIRVRLGDDLLPVRALNEVFVGEKNLSQYVS